MDFSVLGAVEVIRGGEAIPMESAKQRALLAMLLVNANEVVSTDRLIDGLWGEDPPSGGVRTLRFHVSRLRDVLDPDRLGVPLITKSPGYLLEVDPKHLDSARFEAAVVEARELASADPHAAAEVYAEALAMWNGRAYDEFQYEDFAVAEATRLDEARLAAVEGRIDVELALGRHFELVSEIEALVVDHPLRERLTEMWMLALYRSGRQAEALRAYQQLRGRLIDELGAEPGSAISALEQRILEQDPALDVRVASKPAGVVRAIRGYELRELLGTGRLGEVYRAYQPSAGREVAIKVVGSENADVAEFIQRFDVEAQQVAGLDHDHIVPLLDYWREPGSAYLVTRWLRGGDLGDAIQRGRLPVARSIELLDRIGSALDHAHRLGVVHLDVNPSSVLLDDDGTPFLGGFGLGRLYEAMPVNGTGRRPLSPAYSAPEQLVGTRTGPWTDVYQLGLVAYELLTGVHPFHSATPEETVQRRLQEEVASASSLVAELPAAVDEVLRSAIQLEVAERYQDAGTFVAHLSAALEVDLGAPLVTRRNPFKGLAAFQSSDAADFFGREALVDRLVARFAEMVPGNRLLAIVGPSGSGKSSVAAAGVIPALRRGAVVGSDSWLHIGMQPGRHPFDELAAALRGTTTGSPEDLVARMRRDELGIHDTIRRTLPGEGWGLFLLIDQFEELFTMAEEGARSDFIDGLVTAVTHPRSQLRVLVTLRADHFDKPLSHVGLGELMRTRTETVLPLSAAELESAIVGPAAAVGMMMEKGLVGEILGDVNDQPGALPLVEYAMTELFDQSGDKMTIACYRAIGGVAGALGRRADSLFADLSLPARKAAPGVFVELVELGEGLGDTRRRVHVAALLERGGRAVDEVLEKYGDARLLLFDRDPVTRSATVEVAHEALLREWGTLRTWIDDNRDGIRALRRVRQFAIEWEAGGRDKTMLLQGSRLAAVDGLADPKVDQFLTASRQAAARRKSRRRWGVLGLAVLTVISLTAAGLAYTGQRRADIAASEALASKAEELVDSDPALALMVALEAEARSPTALTRGAVLNALDGFTGRVGLRVATLAAFKGAVWSIAFSPDGSQLITANDGLNGLQTWQWGGDYEALLSFEDRHGESLREIAVLGDGRVLTVSRDETMLVWSSLTDSHPAVLTGHGKEVWALDVFEPTMLAVTGGKDGTARVWDIEALMEVAVLDSKNSSIQSTLLPATDGDVWAVRFSPDGSQIVTSGEDGMVRFWKVGSYREVAAVQAHTAPGQDLVYSPDGALVYSAGDDGVVVAIDTATMQVVGPRLAHGGGLRAIDLSTDGTRLVTADADGVAVLWDAGSGQRLARMAGHDGVVWDVSFDPTDRYVITAGRDGTIQVWDTVLSPGLVRVAHSDDVRNLDDKRILSLGFLPDGMRLITGGDNSMRIWDRSTGAEVVARFEPDDQVRSIAVSPDGDLIAGAMNGGSLWLWTGDGTFVGTVELPGKGRGAAFTGDGSQIVVGTLDGETLLIDAANLTVVGRVAPHPEGTRQLAVSPGGILVRAGGDGTATVWRLGDLSTEHSLAGHEAEVRMVAISPDESIIATASADGTVKLWDTGSYSLLRTLTGHIAGVRGLAFSPDGTRLVSAGQDLTAKIWEVDSGSLLATWRRHDGEIWAAAYSPDGNWIATGSADGTALIRYAGSDTGLLCGWLMPYVPRSALVEALGGEQPTVCLEFADG